jgi:beta-lysine 5,6-aminomutase beta subunit
MALSSPPSSKRVPDAGPGLATTGRSGTPAAAATPAATPAGAAASAPLRAYGDRAGDGIVQVSFTLALAPGARAREAAKRFAEMHGLVEPIVATMEPCASGYSFFVVYGQSRHAVDAAAIDVAEIRAETLPRAEIEHRIASRLRRRIVVVGACTGSDAHTVGIDAILNYKGHSGHKGLESYKGFEVHNLGAQVDNEQLAARARATRADAVLVSQVITQRNCHKENGRALVDLVERQGWRGEVILVLGGPRVDHGLALELGFDAGFGAGTRPDEVASYLVERLTARAAP